MRSLTGEQLAGVAVVMIGSFVAALDASIVSTVMPTVVGELGGIDRYALVFSAYLLVSTIATPICGRLADIFGRTPIYVAGMAVFVAGSVGAGLSADMNQLIVSRALQGLGSGALLPVGMTIIGDLFDARGRARIQPVFSTMWLGGALIGPAVGGVLTQAFSWRWAFLVNLPVGIVAIAVLVFVFHETRRGMDEPIDWTGAALLTLASGGLLLALNGVAPLAGAVAVIVGLPLFLRAERTSAHPLFDVALMRDPAIGPGLLLNGFVGVMTLAVSTYLPPFVQGVLGRTPIEAGVVVLATSVGWSSGAVVIAFFLAHLGPRRTALLGTLCWAVGSAILVGLDRTSALPLAVVAAAILGLGMGLTVFPVLVAAQSAVGWSRRGVVTGVVDFSRSMGAAIGVAALGTVLFATMGASAADVQTLLDTVRRGELGPERAAVTADALATGLRSVYLIMIAVAVVGALLAHRLPEALRDQAAQPDAVPVA
ncbi:MAG TPA: MFS transporter [Candidatus Limnocylindria bacterium]|jgi:multidrug resistance protein|nr:MFS transporter [Candidatus Limnocylindria bacterium]